MKETQTCPTKAKTKQTINTQIESIKAVTITIQADPSVINIPETFEFPYVDSDTDDSASASKKTNHKEKSKKVKTKIKNTVPSCPNHIDYMDIFAKLSE